VDITTLILAAELHLGDLCLLPSTDMVAPARIVAFGPKGAAGRDVYVLSARDSTTAVDHYWTRDDAVVQRWP
jgi:hypothetical protein